MLDYRVNCLEEYFLYEAATGANDECDSMCAESCLGYYLKNLRDDVRRLFFNVAFQLGRELGTKGYRAAIDINVFFELGYFFNYGVGFYVTAKYVDGPPHLSSNDRIVSSYESIKVTSSRHDRCKFMRRSYMSALSAIEFEANSIMEMMGLSRNVYSSKSDRLGEYRWENHVGLCESEGCINKSHGHNFSSLSYVKSVGGKLLCRKCERSRMIEEKSKAQEMRAAERVKEKKDKRHISKGLRFSVLDRDKYTCQTCGRSAPMVELEIDHVLPWSKGGKTSIENLQALCVDCNRGKSAKIQKGMAVA